MDLLAMRGSHSTIGVNTRIKIEGKDITIPLVSSFPTEDQSHLDKALGNQTILTEIQHAQEIIANMGSLGDPFGAISVPIDGGIFASVRMPGEATLAPALINVDSQVNTSLNPLPDLKGIMTNSPFRLASVNNFIAATFQTKGEIGKVVIKDRLSGNMVEIDNVRYRSYISFDNTGQRLIYTRNTSDGFSEVVARSLVTGTDEVLAKAPDRNSNISGYFFTGTNIQGDSVEKIVINIVHGFGVSEVITSQRLTGSQQEFTNFTTVFDGTQNNSKGTAKFDNQGDLYLIVEGDTNFPNGALYKVNFDQRTQTLIASTASDEVLPSEPTLHNRVAELDDNSNRTIYADRKGGNSSIYVVDNQGVKVQLKLPLDDTNEAYAVRSINSIPKTNHALVQVATRTGISIFDVNVDTQEVSWEFHTPMTNSMVEKLSEIKTRTIIATSKDGTQIPVELIGNEEAFRRMDGTDPSAATVIVNAYGGFNVDAGPGGFISPGNVELIDHLLSGNIVAIPKTRGGNDYGPQWHDQAKADKILIFEDIIASVDAIRSQNNVGIVIGKGGSHGAWSISGAQVWADHTRRGQLFNAVILIKGIHNPFALDPSVPTQANWLSEYQLTVDSQTGKLTVSGDTPLRRQERLDQMLEYLALYNSTAFLNTPTLVIQSGNDTTVPSAVNATALIQALQEVDAPVLVYDPDTDHVTFSALERAKLAGVVQAFINKLSA